MATTRTFSISSSGKTVGGGSSYTFTCNSSFTIPDGCTLASFKVSKNSQSSSNIKLRNVSSSTTTNLSWDSAMTNTDVIGWTDGGTPKVKVYNSGSSGESVSVTVTFTVNLTKVVQYNKILATDRSKTGTSTTQYAVIKDSNFTTGDKITASAFNSKYLS